MKLLNVINGGRVGTDVESRFCMWGISLCNQWKEVKSPSNGFGMGGDRGKDNVI